MIRDAVINGKHKEIEDLVRTAIENDVKPGTIINDAMIGGMDVVGKRFSQNQIFVPEMLVSAYTMQKGVDLTPEECTATRKAARQLVRGLTEHSCDWPQLRM